MNELIFTGRVWRFGDNVDTDQICPGYALSYPREKLKDHVLRSSSRSDIAAQLKSGDIIVAGSNFGCGSSREQAPVALKDSGIAVVVARSFGRIFRRNAVSLGLAVLQAEVDGEVKDGDIITVEVCSGRVMLPDARVVQGQAPGQNIIATLVAGGLINRVRQELAAKG